MVARIRGAARHRWYGEFGTEEASMLAHPTLAFGLVAAWLEDPDAGVRRWAVELLVRLDRPATRALAPGLLDDPDPDIRMTVCDLLDDVDGLWRLTRDKFYLAERALQRLVALGRPDTAERLVALLPEPDWNRRNRIFTALEHSGAPGIAALLALTSHPDDRTRADACLTLARTRDGAAAPRLIERARDPSNEVAGAAISGLGWLGDDLAIATLIGALASPHPAIADAAVVSLGRLGADRAADALIEMLRAGRGSRRHLVDALAALTPSATIEQALAGVVEDFDADPSAALAAALALGKVGTARCVGALERFAARSLRPLTKQQRREARLIPTMIARLRA